MADGSLAGPPRVRRRLAELSRSGLNFDIAALPASTAATGWTVEDLCQALPDEPRGAPLAGSSWEIARRLMRGYEFADPSIVRAYYDPDTPLPGRTMVLELRAFGVLHIYVGVRVGAVYDQTREVDGRMVRVWGWNYRTLEGHVEMGQMAWEVWKWLDSGAVEFRVGAVSRPAHIANPFVRLGFHVLRGHERRVFLESTLRRMRTFTELGLQQQDAGEIRRASHEMTARPAGDAHPVHDELARGLRSGRHSES